MINIYSTIKAQEYKYKQQQSSKTLANPNVVFRCKSNLKIPQKFVSSTLPNKIKKKFQNLYRYIDITTQLCNEYASYALCNNGQTKIMSYDFDDPATQDVLYCVMAKQSDTNKRKWKLMDGIFNAKEIIKRYNIHQNQLPHSFRSTDQFVSQLNKGVKIKNVLINAKMVNIIKSTKWHKMEPIKRQTNKQRLTLAFTKEEFVKVLIKHVNQTQKEMKLLDILMFDDTNQYKIVYVWIVRIAENIDIGILLTYNEQKDSVSIHDIYLDKLYLLQQHELVNRKHDCQCLDDFKSNINDLKIGNPDDDKNKAQDYKKRMDVLKDENSALKQEIEELKKQNMKQKNNDDNHLLSDNTNNANNAPKTELQIASSSTTPTPSTLSPNSSLSFSGAALFNASQQQQLQQQQLITSQSLHNLPAVPLLPYYIDGNVMWVKAPPIPLYLPNFMPIAMRFGSWKTNN